MTEYDSPWKEFLDAFLKSFVEFCFSELHDAIDWTKPVVTLDKELQQIAPASELGTRTVDKLVEVSLLNGELKWLLIHIEVQSQAVDAFAERMFTYFYRIRDKYNKPLVSIAVLGDDNRKWRPDCYAEDLFGCSIEFRFPLIKLLDYADDIASLESSQNVFATMVLAHVMTTRTAGVPVDRQQWKLRLMRSLYERGKSSDEIRQMFRVLDWMMDLPPELELQFKVALEQIEEEKKMPYVTSVERLAKEEGREEGIQIGQILILQRQLGELPAAIEELNQKSRSELAALLDQLLVRAGLRQAE